MPASESLNVLTANQIEMPRKGKSLFLGSNAVSGSISGFDDWTEILGESNRGAFGGAIFGNTVTSIVSSIGAAATKLILTNGSTALSTTANFTFGDNSSEILGAQFGTALTNYVNGRLGNVISYVRPRLEQRQPAPRNHKGVPLRSIRRGTQFSNADAAEMTALQLLRKMVSHDDFRRYLRHGFVPVRGDSGLVYQIDRINRIAVWDKSEKLAELCVHVRSQTARQIPPTDEVVGKMLIVECDEADIWKRSNVTWYTQERDRPALVTLGVETKSKGGIVIDAGGGIIGAVQGRLSNEYIRALAECR